jgi:hypothetical protein
MKDSIRVVSICFALCAMPLAAAAQDVSYDVDRSKNFAEVRTFTLKPMETSNNPLVDQRVMAAIAADLRVHGLRQVDSNPDVIVEPSLSVEMRKEITAYNTGYWPAYGGWYWSGWGPYWNGYWGGTVTTFSERELQYDTLVISMLDANSGALLWRGRAIERVHSHWKPHEVDKKVQKTVAEIMEKLPANAGAGARVSP